MGRGISKLIFLFYRIILEKRSRLVESIILRNVFDKGICIVHYGSVVISPKAKEGKNSRIYNNTAIDTYGDGFSKRICGTCCSIVNILKNTA